MFLTEVDKQIVRLGSHIMFLEQIVDKQKEEMKELKHELERSKKPVEASGTDQSEVAKQE